METYRTFLYTPEQTQLARVEDERDEEKMLRELQKFSRFSEHRKLKWMWYGRHEQRYSVFVDVVIVVVVSGMFNMIMNN